MDGFYSHVSDAIVNSLRSCPSASRLVDAGCGEGYFPLRIAEHTNLEVLALDLSKDAIKIASRGRNDIYWMVADLTNTPLKNHCADIVTNVFAPANYKEFIRLLTPNGMLLKIIPGNNHLCELRSIIALENDIYSNGAVTDHFRRHFKLTDKIRAGKTMAINEVQLHNFLRMTPLMFGAKPSLPDHATDLRHITIEAEILIGKLS